MLGLAYVSVILIVSLRPSTLSTQASARNNPGISRPGLSIFTDSDAVGPPTLALAAWFATVAAMLSKTEACAPPCATPTFGPPLLVYGPNHTAQTLRLQSSKHVSAHQEPLLE